MGSIKHKQARMCAVIVAAILLVAGWAAAAPAADPQEGLGSRVKVLLDQAKDHGAKGQLPGAWWDLWVRYETARDEGASAAQWESLDSDARRLLNMAVFVEDMRRQKSGMEALLGRFDQAMLEIASLYGVALPPDATGSALAAELLGRLQAANLRRQVAVDSLTVANRRLNALVGGRVAAQDSIITAQKVEVSGLRQRLWETELRVGVAEADRSAAESVLTQKQQREDAVKEIRASFGPREGEILLTPSGQIILHVHGIAFAVGSSELKSGQQALVAKLTDAVRKFPGAQVQVLGHTDDTGGRDANLRLSRRRAETVAGLLAAGLGWEAGAIATDGFGPDQPVALNSTPEGRALNRRIDLVITPGN